MHPMRPAFMLVPAHRHKSETLLLMLVSLFGFSCSAAQRPDSVASTRATADRPQPPAARSALTAQPTATAAPAGVIAQALINASDLGSDWQPFAEAPDVSFPPTFAFCGQTVFPSTTASMATAAFANAASPPSELREAIVVSSSSESSVAFTRFTSAAGSCTTFTNTDTLSREVIAFHIMPLALPGLSGNVAAYQMTSTADLWTDIVVARHNAGVMYFLYSSVQPPDTNIAAQLAQVAIAKLNSLP